MSTDSISFSMTPSEPQESSLPASGSAFGGNCDIWREILSYLEVDLGEDSADEIADKRRAMYHIALLTSGISDCALDSLWKSMTTLLPVIRVCNHPSGTSMSDHTSLQQNMTYRSDDGGSWSMHDLHFIGLQRSRIASYLSRIKNLRLTGLLWKEVTLWIALRGLCRGMMNGEFEHALLPRLRSLTIDFVSTPPQCTWVNILDSLIPPGPMLVDLVIHGSSTTVEGFNQLLSVLHWREVQPKNITYFGAPSTTLLGICSNFKHLNVLRLNFEQYNLDSLNTSGTDNILEENSLPFLTDLEIDLRVYSLHAKRVETPNSESPIQVIHPPTFTNLQRLHVIDDYDNLERMFVSSAFNAPSLHSLTISVGVMPREVSWDHRLSSIIRKHRSIKSLYLRRTSLYQGNRITSEQSSKMKSSDLKTVLDKGSFVSFVMEHIPNSLSAGAISQMARSWPQLETLRIANPIGLSCLYPSTILCRLSQTLPHLKSLALPLNLDSLNQPLPDDYISTNPLQELVATDVHNGAEPHDQLAKLIMAKQLVKIFPKLRTLSCYPDAHKQYFAELQSLVDFFHESVVIYLTYQDRRRHVLGQSSNT